MYNFMSCNRYEYLLLVGCNMIKTNDTKKNFLLLYVFHLENVFISN